MPEICAECAFRKSCETWREPRNHIVSQICAAGPLPFYCHVSIDWRDPWTHSLSVLALARVAGGDLRVCEGWKRAVAARQWPGASDLRWYQRWLAKQALITAERYLEGLASTRELQRDLSPLAEFYRGPRAWQVEKMLERMLGR